MDKTRELVFQQSSEETFDLECGPCKIDNRILLARGYCSDCSDFLCEECYRTHCRPLPSRHHVLLDINNMPMDKTAIHAKDVSSVRCQNHTGELVKYYCPNDSFLGCSICITLQHRACEGVVYIPDEIDGIFKGEEYLNMTKSLQKCLTETEDNTTFIDTTKTEFQRINDSTKDELKQFRSKINAFIDKLEENIEHESNVLHHQNMLVVEAVEKTNQNLGDKIKDVFGELNKKETMQKGIDLYITMKKYTPTVKLFKEEVKDIRNKTKIKKYYFECDTKRLQDAVETAFGKLLFEEAPTDGMELARAMYVGARVQPGKDWGGLIQNNHYGTVTGAHSDFSVNVTWDNGDPDSGYSVGNNNRYELMFVPRTYKSNH